MCYVAPGPRCSSHARKIYSSAKEKYLSALYEGDAEKSEQLYMELQDAEKNYYMTPAGQEDLRAQLDEEGGNGELAYKLEYGIECRKVALQQAKMADRGDVNEDSGNESRVPSGSMNPVLDPEYQRLQSSLDERVNDPRFDELLAERDKFRSERKKLKEEKEKQQAHIEELQLVASDPADKKTGESIHPAEDVIKAQDSIDEEYEKLRTIVDARLDATYAYYLANAEVEKYKDETAKIVVRMNELAGDPGVAYEGETLGNCVRIAEYDSGTREWLEERQKGIGGSDVGTMLKVGEEFAEENFKEFVKSKTEPYTEEEVAAQADGHSGFSGPTGRGNAWETMIVREYLNNNPDTTVMYSKASWVNKGDVRYKANVDGLLSSDGTNPDGILEIKTASDMEHWEEVDEDDNVIEKVPTGYRAQVLWYLKQTGFKYADIAVIVDDKHYRQRRIYANEAIDPTIIEDKKTGDLRPRVPSMNESMGAINEVWSKAVVPRINGTYRPPLAKTSLHDANTSKKIDMAVRQLSAWNDKSHAECESIIKGYAAYKNAARAAGEPILERDAYLVEEFKKSGPKDWTRDRVFVDIETSGMSPDQGEVIEIGITRVNPKGEVILNYTERYGVKDDRTLEVLGTGMQEVHKITPDDIRGKRSFRDPAVQKIMQENLNDPNAVMVAHNEAFEKRWFNQTVDGFWKAHAYNTTRRYHAAREGKTLEPLTTHDTMWSSRYLAHHTSSNKLATFTTGHGIPYENAHSADADTQMTLAAVYAFDELLKSAPHGHRYNPEGKYEDWGPSGKGASK